MKKIFSLLVLLMIAVPEAWAVLDIKSLPSFVGGNVQLKGAITVEKDQAVVFGHGGSIEIQGSITLKNGATLTITGSGGLIILGDDGLAGEATVNGGNGGDGKVAIDATEGKIVVTNNATLEATAGNGGPAAEGVLGAKSGNGGEAFRGNLEMLSGKANLRGGDADGNVTVSDHAKAGVAVAANANVTVKGGTLETSGGMLNVSGGAINEKAVEASANVHITADAGAITINAGTSSDFADRVSTEDMTAAVSTIKESNYFKISAPDIPDYNHYLTSATSNEGTISFNVDHQGTVKEGTNTAEEEDQVYVIVAPEYGFKVKTITAYTFNNFESAGARRRAPSDGIPVLGDEVTLVPVTNQPNTWNFAMPPSSVMVETTYQTVATFDTEGTGDDQKILTPTPVDGIYAGEDKAIVNPGTVAGAPDPQGVVMYLVTDNADMTAEQALAETGWGTTLPTAADFDGEYETNKTVYVWYYIKATQGSGYADSDPVRLEITLLKNMFNVSFDLTNAPETDKADGVWTANPNPAKMGTTVTVKYNGQREVKSVTAKVVE